MSEDKKLSRDELDTRWAPLRRVLETDGVQSCCAAISSEPDDSVRNQLFRVAIQKLGFGENGPTVEGLDSMVTIGDAAIASLRETANRQPGDAAAWLDQANIHAFNLSANLCDCWADSAVREKRHFENGLRFADLALDFRRNLKKGHGPFSMAYWARGKHLLSLGRVDDAVEPFRSSLHCEEEMVREKGGNPLELEAAPDSLLNARAFVGLALQRAGKSEGSAMLDSALAILRFRVEHNEGEAKEDAKIYMDQVEESIRRN